MPKSSYAMSKIDGEVYDSAELDCIYKCMYEMCINDVKINDLKTEWLPTRCRDCVGAAYEKR